MYEGRTDLQPGTVLGHENLGEVIEVGEGVDLVKVGDTVCLQRLHRGRNLGRGRLWTPRLVRQTGRPCSRYQPYQRCTACRDTPNRSATSVTDEGNSVQADTPLPVYAQRRHIFDDVIAAAMKDGDDPATVATVIVAAATAPKPKLRYTAGPTARRVSTLRRIVPARTFDKQIRKINRLPDGEALAR
jgi:NADPH:quinone reductase-like Zn-dependent oxidoreductase